MSAKVGFCDLDQLVINPTLTSYTKFLPKLVTTSKLQRGGLINDVSPVNLKSEVCDFHINVYSR